MAQKHSIRFFSTIVEAFELILSFAQRGQLFLMVLKKMSYELTVIKVIPPKVCIMISNKKFERWFQNARETQSLLHSFSHSSFLVKELDGVIVWDRSWGEGFSGIHEASLWA